MSRRAFRVGSLILALAAVAGPSPSAQAQVGFGRYGYNSYGLGWQDLGLGQKIYSGLGTPQLYGYPAGYGMRPIGPYWGYGSGGASYYRGSMWTPAPYGTMAPGYRWPGAVPCRP